MGWDFWTFMSQPDWFVRLLILKFSIDANYQERKLKQKNANSRNIGHSNIRKR